MTKFYGVGNTGNAKHSDNPRAYRIWHSMLQRCYSPKHIRYQVYGGAGIRMSAEWLCFENFLNDISKVEGWNPQLFEQGLIELDKDYKQKDKKNKVYSLETCTWISSRENQALQPSHKSSGEFFKAVSPDGEVIVTNNQKKLCEDHGLTRSVVNRCLKGERNHHKGWTFEKCSEGVENL